MIRMLMAGALALVLPLGAAQAQGFDASGEWYASVSAGISSLDDSDNSGQTTAAFNTGNGAPAIPNGTTIASGTSVGWTTVFDDGSVISGEVGRAFDNGLRVGVEVSVTQNDVDTHRGVAVGGTVIDAVDAAVLTGSATPLGASVGQVVADGRGEVTSTSLFANVYYDFNKGGRFQPYVGGGIGFSDVEVVYIPSGVPIVDDGETKFAYQVRGGAAFAVTEKLDVFGEATYRATDDIETEVSLFPARLGIENRATQLTVGVRYRFG